MSKPTAKIELPKLCIEMHPIHPSIAVFTFEHEDSSIHDPFLSTCGRFVVDPVKDYGLQPGAGDKIKSLNIKILLDTKAAVNAIAGAHQVYDEPPENDPHAALRKRVSLEIAERMAGELRAQGYEVEPMQSNLMVSLDGGLTYFPADDGVRVIRRGLPFTEERQGDVHMNVTPEGHITDLWSGDTPCGTDSCAFQSYVDRLLDEDALEADQETHSPAA